MSIRGRIGSYRTGRSNRRNQKARERGRETRRAGAAAWARSKTPVYRNRINPAHGNPHREDARLQRSGNKSLARFKQARERARADCGGDAQRQLDRAHQESMVRAMRAAPGREVPAPLGRTR